MSNHGLKWVSATGRRLGGLVALLGLTMGLPAQALVTIRLERLSDTDALMRVSGQIDAAAPGANAHSLALMDPFAIRPDDTDNSWVLEQSNLQAGSFVFNFANQAGRCAAACPGGGFDNSGRANTVHFGNNDLVFPPPFPFQPIPAQTPLVGSMVLQLQNGATFAPSGASGDVYWGTTTLGLGLGVLVGTWEIAAVPEPGSFAMVLAGLGLLAGAGSVRQRRRAPLPL